MRFSSPSSRGRALDVGCANGVFAHSLFSVGFREVWGVEPDAQCARRAAARLTGVIAAPFPSAETGEHGTFDLIVFGDSLEHLQDPWTSLSAARKLLSDDGVLILSVPNVAHFSVVLPLLRGRWDYADSGLLDRTHLRFFTPQSIVKTVLDAGLVPVHERDVCVPPQRPWKRLVVRATRVLAPHLTASKVDLVCRRRDP
jgi:2-polyprenyl-3-methyl-5-hydroxy-6-metoxy-1,4-benzoquinol methylase